MASEQSEGRGIGDREGSVEIGRTLKIAIVGAGIAGLAAADRLQEYGISATMFEAQGVVGGRMKTGAFRNGEIFEYGGEVMGNPSEHPAMHALAKKHGVPLINTTKTPDAALPESYRVDGKDVPYDELEREFQTVVWPALQKDIVRAGGTDGLVYNIHTANKVNQYTEQLNHMSLEEYLDTLPLSRNFRSLIGSLYVTEQGKPLHQQSALNYLRCIAWCDGQLKRFVTGGRCPDTFRFAGGNSDVTSTMKDAIQEKEGEFRLGHALKAIEVMPDGTYDLHFSVDGERKFVQNFDVVALSIPLTVLAKAVDLSKAGLTEVRMQAINDAKYGDGIKTMLNLRTQAEGLLGKGSFAMGNDVGQIWNSSVGREPRDGQGKVLTQFSSASLGFPKGSNAIERAALVVQAADAHFPGASEKFTGEFKHVDWVEKPFSLGSYYSPSVGEYGRFGAIETPGSGDDAGIWFIGEHANAIGNDDHPGNGSYGFMNDGAESGIRFADGIAKISDPTKYHEVRARLDNAA